MSAPARNHDSLDDPLRYAPHWARQSEMAEDSGLHEAPPIDPTCDPAMPMPGAVSSFTTSSDEAPASTLGSFDAPPMAPGVGGFNIDVPPARLRPFEGDVAVKALRHRLAVNPELVPEPPLPEPPLAAPVTTVRVVPFLVLLVAAAVITFAVTLLLMPREGGLPSGATASIAPPEVLPRQPTLAESARLVVENQRALANEPLPLGVSLNDGTGRETLTLVGLANGTRLTAGTPLGSTGWQMAARELGEVYAYAPKDFVGVMDAAIDLHSARDRLVDSQVVRLEWLPKAEARLVPARPAPVVQALDPEEVQVLMKRGDEFLKNGDIAAARLFLRRAANADNAQAALTLGLTYDPAFLAERGVLGFAPEPAQARRWYQKALELGLAEASQRLDRLASRGP